MKRFLKKDAVKLLKDIAFNTNPLDSEEKEQLEDWKNIKESDIEFNDKTLAEVKQAQKAFKTKYKRELKKDKLISIRLNSSVIDNIKNIADNLGLNYQSYIGMLISQAAVGNIRIKIEQA
jgi:predicted DNA binding CopG/RHH family protein